MTASANFKMWGEVTGLGEDNKLSNNWTDGLTPTEPFGPLYVTAINTAGQQLDIVSLSTVQLRALEIKCLSGNVWINPIASTNISIACFISAGGGNFYTYQGGTAAVSVAVWIMGDTSAAAIQYLCYGVSTV